MIVNKFFFVGNKTTRRWREFWNTRPPSRLLECLWHALRKVSFMA